MLLKLDRQGPLYSQVYRAIRADILNGRTRPGVKVPSTRSIASELAVSRNIVVIAYEQLLAEGYLVTRTGAGTFVAAELPEKLTLVEGDERARSMKTTAPPRLSAYASRIETQAQDLGFTWAPRRVQLSYDFRYGRPSFADFPHATWCRILARRARQTTIRDLDYGPAEGAPALREALADYLHRARGVNCTAEQILIVNGSQQALDLTARVLIDAGDRVALEEPNYRAADAVFRAAGAVIDNVEVDDNGMRVEDLAARRRSYRVVAVTPSHQFPTGALMPLGRRLELLDWAHRTGALIFEDDYDSEYRYQGRPIEALQSLDEHGRVIYAGTFSKLMFPALRLGYVVVPAPLMRSFRFVKALLDTGCATLPQLALVDFMREGHFERHLRLSRARNAARREAILAAIAKHLGDGAEVSGANAGLHVLMRLRDIPYARTSEIRKRAERLGVGAYSAGPFFRTPPREASLLLGYASLTEKEIAEGIRRLASAVQAS
jgi:GntR family transcriptional regulator/MocR family aminotransferase